MNQQNNNKLWLLTINIVIVLLLILLFASILIAANEISINEIKFSKESFDRLGREFEGSIKIMAGIIAILTIKVYFLNMKRTDTIIERTNKQFNAYVKNENLKNYFYIEKNLENILVKRNYLRTQ
ncbi:MAG: hypothetical protein IPL63_13860 [Saprospiraceae bacterium]|nr:hypothetical protein [Saprospiraceae bacterium]